MLNNTIAHYSRVCIVNTVYSLFIYLLISSRDDVDHTFFFFSDGIDKNIRNKFLTSYYISDQKLSQKNVLVRTVFRVMLRIVARFKWPFLSSAMLYGHDHLLISPALVGKKKIIVLEDGNGNYDMFALKPVYTKALFLRKLLFGPLVTAIPFGGSCFAEKVILTGLGPIPDILQKKAEVINLFSLWKTLSVEDQERILNYFSLQTDELNRLAQKSIILFTQPFAEDITTEVLIGIYRGMLKDLDLNEVVIKRHPRDGVDYQAEFPDAYVYEKNVPMELLTLLGIRFLEAYTISSSAVLFLPEPIKIHYAGNDINKILLEKYGDIKLEDLKG